MPRLNQKKTITLRAKVSREYTKEIEVNPSIRLTAVQHEIDLWVARLMSDSALEGTTIEVTAEGLV